MKHYKLTKNGEIKFVSKLVECNALMWEDWEYLGMEYPV